VRGEAGRRVRARGLVSSQLHGQVTLRERGGRLAGTHPGPARCAVACAPRRHLTVRHRRLPALSKVAVGSDPADESQGILY